MLQVEQARLCESGMARRRAGLARFTMSVHIDPRPLPADLPARIRTWAAELGFQQTGFTHFALDEDAAHLRDWLAARYHGDMDYMERHAELRADPARLVPNAISAVCVRMDYGEADPERAWATLNDGERAYVARYALGRDYHKVLRNRLQKLADKMAQAIGPFGYRVFTDSAPVLERALSRDAGLGWIGKHTCLIQRDAGSWFFLGEILTDLPLPPDEPATAHCGTCTRCIEVCPTKAIVAPWKVDARRCISYLTIENKGAIPVEFRRDIGNRIYGCDDCQLICPWNKFAQRHDESDFAPRHRLDTASLAELFAWDESEFLTRTEGSPIRRAGYPGWLRNLAVALGNAPSTPEVLTALHARAEHESELVREHVAWALECHALPPPSRAKEE